MEMEAVLKKILVHAFIMESPISLEKRFKKSVTHALAETEHGAAHTKSVLALVLSMVMAITHLLMGEDTLSVETVNIHWPRTTAATASLDHFVSLQRISPVAQLGPPVPNLLKSF